MKTGWKPESIAWASQVVDIDTFGAIVGAATSAIRQLCIDKKLPAIKKSRGRREGWWLTINEAVPAYMAHKFSVEKARHAEAVERLKEDQKGPRDDMWMRRESAKTELMETKIRILKGELVSTIAVLKVLNDDYSQIRSVLVNLPDRLYRIIAGKTDADEIKELLTSEIERAINALRKHAEEDFHSSSDPELLRQMDMLESSLTEMKDSKAA
jgi:hypothetical protein